MRLISLKAPLRVPDKLLMLARLSFNALCLVRRKTDQASMVLLNRSLRLFATTFRTATFEQPLRTVQSHKSDESLDALRKRVYLETLKHVPQLGFTQRAVGRAVHSLGLPPTLNSVFRDGAELALHFYADGNRQTREFMHSHLDAVRRGVEPYVTQFYSFSN
jgi:hypothetical protein